MNSLPTALHVHVLRLNSDMLNGPHVHRATLPGHVAFESQMQRNTHFLVQEMGSYELVGHWVRYNCSSNMSEVIFCYFEYEFLSTIPDNDTSYTYIWVANGVLLYVGETGVGIMHRSKEHKYALNKIDSKKRTLLVNIDTSRIDVYASRVPAFYNFITQPEYRLHVMEDKRTRLLEESALIRFFHPCLNAY